MHASSSHRPPRRKRASLIGLFCLIAVALAACDNKQIFGVRVDLPCPNRDVIDDAKKRVQFRDDGQDLTDVLSEVEITGISIGCATLLDRQTLSGSMDVAVQVAFDVKRGPANRTRVAPFSYFISVVNNARKVLYREEFELTPGFSGTKNKISINGQRVVLELPIQSGQTGRTYNVLVGMALTREELAYNRKKRRQAQEGGVPR